MSANDQENNQNPTDPNDSFAWNPPASEDTAARPQESENVLAGIVGAFLFSLSGGILFFILYQIGILAAISGIVGVICAMKGYTIFSKKESLHGIIISTAIAILVLVIAWYLCLSMDVYQAWNEWYANGEVDYTITFFDSVRGAYQFLADPEVASGYWIDLGLGILLCVAGCIQPIINACKKLKK